MSKENEPLIGITAEQMELAVNLDACTDGELLFTAGDPAVELRIMIRDDRELLRAWTSKMDGCFRLRIELMPENDDEPAPEGS